MAVLKLLVATCCLLFLQISPTIVSTPALPPPGRSSRCIASERDALLAFKAGLSDPANYLSSWEGVGCCEWLGILCSNRTGHVLELHLHSSRLANSSIGFLGDVTSSSSLLALHQLRCLNLSSNNFNGTPIPEFIGGLENLRRLDLSDANFGGRVPPHLGNLSKLHYLDLNVIFSDFLAIYSADLDWISRLTALQYLDLSAVNLSAVIDWAHIVNKLPSLVTLNLRYCELQNTVPSI